MNPLLQAAYAHSPIGLQDLLVSLYGWRIRRRRFNREHERWMEMFDGSQWWSAVEIEQYQDERLRGLVTHCYDAVPFYRRTMDERRLRPADIRGRADLVKLPVITKDVIRRDPDQFLARGARPGALKESPTSGTTGTSFAVLWDRATDVLWNALLWRHRSWIGFRFGDRYASLLGRVIAPLDQQRPPFWRRNRPWNQVLFSSFHLKESHIAHYVRAFRELGIGALECYPSTGYILARFLETLGERLPLRHVVTSSETLLPIQRESMERAFGTGVHDYYGLSEAVLFAGECGQGPGLHLSAEIGVAEVLDEHDRPVAPGGHGRLVGTGLVNRAMPLLRYETGDVSAVSVERCPCGRGLPRLDPVTTKAEDIVVTPDGRLVSSSTLTHPFKPLDQVVRSQIIQEATDRLLVRIVPRPGYSEADTRHLVTEIRRRVGEDVRVDVELVDDIPVGPAGKYRWIISRVPLRFGALHERNLFEADAAERVGP